MKTVNAKLAPIIRNPHQVKVSQLYDSEHAQVTSTAFGLMASALLVLPALPCFYMIFGDLGWIENSGANRHA